MEEAREEAVARCMNFMVSSREDMALEPGEEGGLGGDLGRVDIVGGETLVIGNLLCMYGGGARSIL